MNDGRRIFYVYILLRPENKEPFYVGKGCGGRHKRHVNELDISKNRHKNNIIKKILAAGNKVECIKVAEGLLEKDAFELEKFWIVKIGRAPVGPLTNQTNGGEGVSMPMSPERRAALIAFNTGSKRSAEIRAKMRGRPVSAEERLARSKALKGRPCAEGTRLAVIESNKKRKGKPWSENQRQRAMAGQARRRGIGWTPEVRRKMMKGFRCRTMRLHAARCWAQV